MIDPILSLAVTVHSNKGVYALLLGSGVSGSSGIPTGWEIVQDLIRRLARLKGAACEPDPESWYRAQFGSEPDYSDVLDAVAKSSTERRNLLRAYFEPSEDEREEGKKQPTPAHKAISELVSRGYVRVIVTTNFDRLLEQALSAAGIQPVVVATGDAAQGAPPLAHSRCTILKTNGDYLDTRLRNTRDELKEYDAASCRLLTQIFDEYGLIVCGWSGEWDTALRALLERCASRRFWAYWASRGDPGETAQRLIAFRGASVLRITDADAFFGELLEKVTALEDLSAHDPLPARVAVARMKRYLASDAHRISLHDLLASESERVHAAIGGPRFPARAAADVLTPESILGRLRAYESELNVSLAMLIGGAYWAEEQHHDLLVRALKRLADRYEPESGLVASLNLRRYPALVLTYGMGLAALGHNNYAFLKALLHLGIRSERYEREEPLVTVVHDQAVLQRDLQKRLPGREREFTPLSNHLLEFLREPLREYIPDDNVYDDTFDWFEYLFGLVHCDVQVTRQSLAELKAQREDLILWGPVGRFGWKPTYGEEGGIQQQTELRPGELYPERVARALRAGFFESGGQLSHDDKYRDVKAAFDRHVERVRHGWGVW